MKRSSNQAFLVGRRLYLRPMEPSDLDHVRSWVNSQDVRDLIGSHLPMTSSGAAQWLERASSNRDRVWFAVVLSDGDRLIGECGLLKISQPWRSADCTMIIGEADCWMKGYGSEAARLLIEYAFGSLNLNRLSVWVASSNPRAVAWWQKMGFQHEGVVREGYYHHHQYHDFIIMGLLEREYRAGASHI